MMDGKKLTLGVCYYPEHWPEALWDDDLTRMKAHGIEVVRVAEFAWSLFEPSEGKYEFDLFDRFLALAGRHKMQIIFCTPTATPPAWLTEKYPEVLNADVSGTLYRHGLRRHYNYNSDVYRRFTVDIVRAMGEHYGAHPAIIGWQIDNELNCEIAEFYAEADHQAFRCYLKDKYGTLENLNEKMGTVVWSQQYSDWSELHLRRPTTGGQYNPHLLLEEKRFISWSAVRYCTLQCDTLRPYIGDGFITTNGIFPHLNYKELMDGALDFLCYDSYPNFALDMNQNPADTDDIKDRKWSRNLMATRAVSQRFGIMEQQSGANGWTGRMEAPMPRPGQMRLWTMQSVAHGADFVSYFRWRTAPVGTEIYWHGILDYDNAPNRRLAELGQINQDFERLAPLAGSQFAARVAYVRDYANEWDAEFDVWHRRVHETSMNGWFRACQHTHTPMDYLYIDERTTVKDLFAYGLLVYPHATILEKETADKLAAYVHGGGTLVFGARSGYKDQYGRCPMRPLAGFAGELCGARVKDYTFIGPYDEAGMVDWDGARVDACTFNDVLEPCEPDAQIDATYAANYYRGEAAMISRTVGEGRAFYFGAAFNEAAATAFLQRLGHAEPYGGLLELSPGIELAVREKDDGCKIFIVLNYQRAPEPLTLHAPMTDLLSEETYTGRVDLPAYGVMALVAAGHIR